MPQAAAESTTQCHPAQIPYAAAAALQMGLNISTRGHMCLLMLQVLFKACVARQGCDGALHTLVAHERLQERLRALAGERTVAVPRRLPGCHGQDGGGCSRGSTQGGGWWRGGPQGGRRRGQTFASIALHVDTL